MVCRKVSDACGVCLRATHAHDVREADELCRGDVIIGIWLLLAALAVAILPRLLGN